MIFNINKSSEEVNYEEFMKTAQKTFEEWTGASMKLLILTRLIYIFFLDIRRNTKKVTETITPNMNMNHLSRGRK